MKNIVENTNAVIYARFSSHAQNEQSIDGQIRVCTEYAQRNGLTVISSYCDAALSGTVDARPQFQKMIEDSEKHQFSHVIVYKLDRFARNRYDSATYKYRLKRNGVKVVSAMEQIGDDPTGILLEAVLEASAEYYSVNLAENVRRGRQDSASKGFFVGGTVPLGYKIVDHRLALDERLAPVVRRVFEMYADGEGQQAINDYLNPLHIVTRYGSELNYKSFHNAFPSTTYKGILSQSGVESECPALVSEETWDRVQRRIGMNRHRPQRERAHEEYLLTGKLFCGHCGSPMAGVCGRGKLGNVYYYYSCKGHREKSCDKRNEQKDVIERWVVQQTVAHVLNPKRIKEIASQIVERYRQEFGASTVAELEKRVDLLRRKADRLLDELIECPEPARPSIREKYVAADAERQESEIELAKQKIASNINVNQKDVEGWLRMFADGDEGDIRFQRRMIDTFVNSVYVYDDKIVIWYNIKGESEPIGLQKSEEILKEKGSFMESCGSPSPSKSKPFYTYYDNRLGLVFWR